MLNCCRDDVLTKVLPSEGRLNNCRVVTFRSATREDDLVIVSIDALGDQVPAVFHHQLGMAPVGIPSGGVPPGLLHLLVHRVEDFRCHRGGGGIVQIDFTHFNNSSFQLLVQVGKQLQQHVCGPFSGINDELIEADAGILITSV